MQKVIPNRNPALLSFALEVAAGAEQYGDSIPLVLNPADDIDADVTGHVEGTTASGQAATELTTRLTTMATAVRTSRGFLTLARDNAKPVKGSRYNPGWQVMGFKNSLKIPTNVDDVLPLLVSFKEFLTGNPTFEVVPKNITAAQAKVLFDQLDAARTAVNQQETHIGNMRLDRDAKATKLRKRMQHTIAELNQKLSPLDMRWLAFGLNRPGLPKTPEVPANVTVVLVGPTAAAVTWNPAVRAQHYRVWIRTAATEPWVNVGSPADLDFTIEVLLRNTTTEVAVSAVNSGGESAKSEPVTITTPA